MLWQGDRSAQPLRAALPPCWSWPSAQLDRHTNLLKLSCDAALLPVADDAAGSGPCDWNCEGEADEWLCALASSEVISTSMAALTGGRSGDPRLVLFFSGQQCLAFWGRVSSRGRLHQVRPTSVMTSVSRPTTVTRGWGGWPGINYLDRPPRRLSGTYLGCRLGMVWGGTREEAGLLEFDRVYDVLWLVMRTSTGYL